MGEGKKSPRRVIQVVRKRSFLLKSGVGTYKSVDLLHSSRIGFVLGTYRLFFTCQSGMFGSILCVGLQGFESLPTPLITDWSGVQVPPRPPLTATFKIYIHNLGPYWVCINGAERVVSVVFFLKQNVFSILLFVFKRKIFLGAFRHKRNALCEVSI